MEAACGVGTATPTDPQTHVLKIRNPGHGTQNAKFGRGEEKPKETEQRKIIARERGNRRALQDKVASIFATRYPRGDC